MEVGAPIDRACATSELRASLLRGGEWIGRASTNAPVHAEKITLGIPCAAVRRLVR